MSDLSRELSDLASTWSVVETTVHVPVAPAVTQICSANPLRWGLIVASTSTATVPYSLSTTSNPGAGKGIEVPANFTVPPLSFTYNDYGGLVQQAWFAQPTGAGAIDLTVIEIRAQQ